MENPPIPNNNYTTQWASDLWFAEPPPVTSVTPRRKRLTPENPPLQSGVEGSQHPSARKTRQDPQGHEGPRTPEPWDFDFDLDFDLDFMFYKYTESLTSIPKVYITNVPKNIPNKYNRVLEY
jgi:hypothetical protein